MLCLDQQQHGADLRPWNYGGAQQYARGIASEKDLALNLRVFQATLPNEGLNQF